MAKGKSKSGTREIHPTDAFRKEQRKRELKKNKKDRERVREVTDLLNNPERIEDEIRKVQKESDENRLDKRLKDRLKELQLMKSVALKKQKIRDQQTIKADNQDENESEESDAKDGTSHREKASIATVTSSPEDSIYYHPVFNPTGAPPPGMPMMMKSSSQNPPLPPAPPPPPHTGVPQNSQFRPPTVVSIPGTSPYQFTPFKPPLPPTPPPQTFLNSMGPRGVPIPIAPSLPTGLVLGGTNGIPLPPPRIQGTTIRAVPHTGGPLGGMPPPRPMHAGVGGRGSSVLQGDPSLTRKGRGHDRNQLLSEDPLDPSSQGYLSRFSQPAPPSKRQGVSAPPPPEHTLSIVNSAPIVTVVAAPSNVFTVEKASMLVPISATHGSLAFTPSQEPFIPNSEPPPTIITGDSKRPSMRPPPPSSSLLGLVDYGEDDDEEEEEGEDGANEEVSARSTAASSSSSLQETRRSVESKQQTAPLSAPNIEEILRRRFQLPHSGAVVEAGPASLPVNEPRARQPKDGAEEELMSDVQYQPQQAMLYTVAGPVEVSAMKLDTPQMHQTYGVGTPHAIVEALAPFPVPAPSVTAARGVGPKLIKQDRELTGFVPAALRLKRAGGLTVRGIPPKIPKTTQNQIIGNTSDSIQSGGGDSNSGLDGVRQSKITPAARIEGVSVDDAYTSFMAEIESLGNFES